MTFKLENSFDLEINGIDEVTKAFQALPDLLKGKIALVALRQGGNYLKNEIKQVTPVSTKGSRELDLTGRGVYQKYPPGRLKGAISVKKSRIKTINNNGTIGLYISINQGRKRNDPRGAWYGKFVEQGHAIDSRSVSVKEAVKLGLVSKEYVDARRKQSLINQRQGQIKKTGRVQERIRFRSAGTRRVAGRFFIKKTFSAHSEKAAKIISDSFEIAAAEALRNLGLAVTGR